MKFHTRQHSRTGFSPQQRTACAWLAQMCGIRSYPVGATKTFAPSKFATFYKM